MVDRQIKNLSIDPERLWDDLKLTAKIGATAKGGICRLTLTDLDREVRDWFKAQTESLGCAITVDDMARSNAQPAPRSCCRPCSTTTGGSRSV